MVEKTVIQQIRSSLPEKRVNSMLLIHRTNFHVAPTILEEGFKTEISKYGMLESVATLHGRLDATFAQHLEMQHRNSTHHFVMLLPGHAVETLRDFAGQLNIKIPRRERYNILADALGGTIPKEWIVGHYSPESGKFTPNPVFNAAHKANFTNWNNAVTPFHKANVPRRRPG